MAKLIKRLDLLWVQDGFRGCLEIRNEKVNTTHGQPPRLANADTEHGLPCASRRGSMLSTLIRIGPILPKPPGATPQVDLCKDRLHCGLSFPIQASLRAP